MLVVVLQEVQHVLGDVEHLGMHRRNAVRGRFATPDRLQRVIETNLVVQVVHAAELQVVAVQVGVVNLGQQERIVVGRLDRGVEVAPELDRHHLRHVVTESIHPFRGPVQRDVTELGPAVRYIFPGPEFGVLADRPVTRFIGQLFERIAAIGPYAVVHLDGFIPVVERRLRCARAVTGPLGGRLIELAVDERVGLTAKRRVVVRKLGYLEVFADNIVEVVVPGPFDRRVVAGTEVLDTVWS